MTEAGLASDPPEISLTGCPTPTRIEAIAHPTPRRQPSSHQHHHDMDDHVDLNRERIAPIDQPQQRASYHE